MKKLKYKDFYGVSGIYKITNILNDKFYIGSSVNLYGRNRSHYNSLKHGTHSNQKLQFAANKYGLDNFYFEVICLISESNLLIVEGEYIGRLKPEYNIDSVDPNGKRTCSDSTKKLIGEKSKQKFIDKPELLEQQRQKMKKIGVWNKGLTGIYSNEVLEKMSKAGVENIKNRPKEIQDKFFQGREKAWLTNKKKIIQYDLNMNFIKEWDSMTDAAKTLGAKSVGNFHTACKKGIKLFNSYWSKKE